MGQGFRRSPTIDQIGAPKHCLILGIRAFAVQSRSSVPGVRTPAPRLVIAALLCAANCSLSWRRSQAQCCDPVGPCANCQSPGPADRGDCPGPCCHLGRDGHPLIGGGFHSLYSGAWHRFSSTVEPVLCWPVKKCCYLVNFCAPDHFCGPPDIAGPGRFFPVPTHPVFEAPPPSAYPANYAANYPAE
jgi:hypothetical protein